MLEANQQNLEISALPWGQWLEPLIVAERSGDWEETVAICRRWIKQEEWNPIPYFHLGCGLRSQGRLDDATWPLETANTHIANLHPALKDGPNGYTAKILSTLADHYVDLNRHSDALMCARFLCVKVDSYNLGWLYNLASLCVMEAKKTARKQRSFDLRKEALTRATEIIENFSNLPQAYVLYVRVVAQLGLEARVNEAISKLTMTDAEAGANLVVEANRLLDVWRLEQQTPKKRFFGIF